MATNSWNYIWTVNETDEEQEQRQLDSVDSVVRDSVDSMVRDSVARDSVSLVSWRSLEDCYSIESGILPQLFGNISNTAAGRLSLSLYDNI